ncbi:collagen alpha-1(XXIV) chain-like [Temnothorax curvispinosus]|uniref:Collagen alpha-1(XXIV) chain-like n=1 Tax=Temnothorax curvispinosus TaxID=300111 RepID=A0A6J1RFJ2_9HYME|nr:collagen alpha-1(XXIV) chain-like [Temnothorax curvispinosus]
MLKYTILFTTVFCMVQSQRPWHAGSGSRLPQVLPQYIDERIAAEQAAQAGQAAQGNQTIPNQGIQGTSGSQGAQEIPVRQGAQGIPVNQGAQEIPVRQGAQGIPVNQGAQGIPTYQGAQGIPTYQGAQGIPTYQGAQGIPTYQGAQGNSAEQEVQGTPITGTGNTLLGNRIDSGDGGFAAAPPLSTTINPADLPVDAHGDIDLVNRIKTWPRDKQPFWYINWQAIQAHRGDVNNTGQPAQTQPNSRSFFAG